MLLQKKKKKSHHDPLFESHCALYSSDFPSKPVRATIAQTVIHPVQKKKAAKKKKKKKKYYPNVNVIFT